MSGSWTGQIVSFFVVVVVVVGCFFPFLLLAGYQLINTHTHTHLQIAM